MLPGQLALTKRAMAGSSIVVAVSAPLLKKYHAVLVGVNLYQTLRKPETQDASGSFKPSVASVVSLVRVSTLVRPAATEMVVAPTQLSWVGTSGRVTRS